MRRSCTRRGSFCGRKGWRCVRPQEVMGHGEREASHAPGHGQPRWRRVEKATPSCEWLEVPNSEHMAQVHVEE